MRTDPVLQELYGVRERMVNQATSAEQFFAQRLAHQKQNILNHPEVKWVDFSHQQPQRN